MSDERAIDTKGSEEYEARLDACEKACEGFDDPMKLRRRYDFLVAQNEKLEELNTELVDTIDMYGS